MREIINLCESPEWASSVMVREAEAAVQEACGDHISMTLIEKADRKVELLEIEATPMAQGWGSKALTIICGLADAHGITLTLEVDNDSNDWDYDEDEDDEDEYPDVPSEVPSDMELTNLYSRFGFEEQFSLASRIQMLRKPAKITA